MYQGISAGVPKTAYLKLIDVWVFFCLLVPFIVFLIEFTWEVKKNKEEQKLCELKATQAWSDSEIKNMINRPKIIYRTQVQYLIVVLTVAFVIGYFVLAFFFRNHTI